MILENINSPEDVKKLSIEELNLLSGEIREALLHRLSDHGGHFGPNFGMVEATIALHYVFNSPEDKIVFDVSHQSYPHKMLTGRKDAYLYPEKYDDVSGYSEPSESAHDHFVIGHTSTSVSLAGGLAKGRDLKGEKRQCHCCHRRRFAERRRSFRGIGLRRRIGHELHHRSQRQPDVHRRKPRWPVPQPAGAA